MDAHGNGSLEDGPEAAGALARQAPRTVLVARALLVALAVAAAIAGFLVNRRDAATAAASQRRYVCPMHPNVTSATPAECPVCGMALSEARGGPALAAWREPPPVRQPGAFDAARRRIFTQGITAVAEASGARSVRALLYADEVETLEPGERALFLPSAAPAAKARVHRAGSAPEPAALSALWVEFQLEPGEAPLRPGAAGWVELPARQRPVLVIPSIAVLQSAAGPYVYASSDGRAFARRQVALGKTLFGLTTVSAGLREGERVATRSASFLDAEARLSASARNGP